MKLSPFNPIFFPDAARRSDGIESRCVQTFATTDGILFELFLDEGETAPDVKLVTIGGMERTLAMTANGLLRYTSVYPADGYYQLKVGDMLSYPFHCTSDNSVLGKTTLIQYTSRDNRQRTDVAFLIGNERHVFSFRVPGGFKEGDVSFGCDNEQFTTQEGDIVTLYSKDSVQEKFTMGSAIGVPVRFAVLLNRLLSCSFVFFNGVRYERSGTATPEQAVTLEGIDSFIYKQQLQRVVNLAPLTVAEAVAYTEA